MAKCMCMVQEGQIPDPVLETLGEKLNDIVVSHKLGAAAEIAWIVIPRGRGWTAGEPSTSSVVTVAAPPIEQSHRETILTEICDMWCKATGCHINQIVATVMPA